MKQFRDLTVARIVPETRDSLRIALDVPQEFEDEFRFLPGQHLPFQVTIDGRKLRRTYSICSGIDERPLEIGVRVQPGGAFSEFAAHTLKVGDTLQAMPPSGQFRVEPDATKTRDYVGFAAGSGITPILSMMKSILEAEAGSRFILFYGNRRQATTMFIEDLYALKNRFVERVQLNFVFSQEEQEFDAMAGRLDGDKVRDLYRLFGAGLRTSDAFVCGPDSMIADVTGALVDLGMKPERVHAERFGVPRKGGVKDPQTLPGNTVSGTGKMAAVTIVMDGHKQRFDMPQGVGNFVDAAADAGIDLPYSCKGGVCATCRCLVREGSAEMGTNYGLEPWEVDAGFVLACQTTPTSDAVTLDYDET